MPDLADQPDATSPYDALSSEQLHDRAVVLLGPDYLDESELGSVENLRDPAVVRACIADSFAQEDRERADGPEPAVSTIRRAATTDLADAVFSDRIPEIWLAVERCFDAGLRPGEVRIQLVTLAMQAFIAQVETAIEAGERRDAERLSALDAAESIALFEFMPLPGITPSFHVLHELLGGGSPYTIDELGDRLADHFGVRPGPEAGDNEAQVLPTYLRSMIINITNQMRTVVTISGERRVDASAVVADKVFTYRVDHEHDSDEGVDATVDLSAFACFDHLHLDGDCQWLGFPAYDTRIANDNDENFAVWAEVARRRGIDPEQLTNDWAADSARPGTILLDGFDRVSLWVGKSAWVPGFDRPQAEATDTPTTISMRVDRSHHVEVHVLPHPPAVDPVLAARMRAAYDQLQAWAARQQGLLVHAGIEPIRTRNGSADAPGGPLPSGSPVGPAEQIQLVDPARFQPILVETILVELLVDHPESFATPQAPIADLLMAAGLLVRDDEVLHTTAPWDRADDAGVIALIAQDYGDATAKSVEQLLAMIDGPERTRPELIIARSMLDKPSVLPELARVMLRVAPPTVDTAQGAAETLADKNEAERFNARAEALLAFAEGLVDSASRLEDQCSAHVLASHALFALHRPEEAVARIDLAATAPDAPGEAVYEIGILAFDRGDYRSAVRWWDKLEKPPHAMKAARAFDRAGTPDVGRNERCPCGSGRKFKQCHLGKPVDLTSVDHALRLSAKLRRLVTDGGPGYRDLVGVRSLREMSAATIAKVHPDGDGDGSSGGGGGWPRSVPLDPKNLAFEVAEAIGHWPEWLLERRGSVLPPPEQRILEGLCAQQRTLLRVEHDHPGDVSPATPLLVRAEANHDVLIVSAVPTRESENGWTAGEHLVARPWPLADETWCIGADAVLVHPSHLEGVAEMLATRNPTAFLLWIASVTELPGP